MTDKNNDVPQVSKIPSRRPSVHDAMAHVIAKERVDLRDPHLHEKAIAEFTGTFMLVFTVGVAVASGAGGHAAMAIGLMLGIQIYCFGSVSGAMFNPAVTLAVLLSRREKIAPKEAAVYVAVQCLGGLIAGFLSFGVTNKSFCFDYEQLRAVEVEPNFGSSLILEIIFSMALCTTVLTTGTSNDCPNQYFGFAIGLTVTAGALASGGFDQGSFNPAVTIGMNLGNYANSDSTHNPSGAAWVLYLFAPLIGSCLSALIYRGTRGNEYETFALEKERMENEWQDASSRQEANSRE